jgi:hypothetical protein
VIPDEARREFEREWQVWRHTVLPVDACRADRADEPTFTVEFALDHLRSYVYALGSSFIEERPRDYATHTADLLERLHEAEADLEFGIVPEQERAPYRAYVAATRAVLHRLLAASMQG